MQYSKIRLNFLSILFLQFFLLFSVHAKGESLDRGAFIDKFFNDFNINTIDTIYNFYDPSIVFEDPLGSHSGIESIKKYYQNLYQNVEYIRFDFSSHICEKDQCASLWTMHLRTPNLNGGEQFAVVGNSVFKFNEQGKVIYHRDYFDMGEFIYERIPIIKSVIGYIKKKLSGK